MTTLSLRCKEVGLSSAVELIRITGTSKETLTNWMKFKPVLFEVVLKGALQNHIDILEHNRNILYESKKINLLIIESVNSYGSL